MFVATRTTVRAIRGNSRSGLSLRFGYAHNNSDSQGSALLGSRVQYAYLRVRLDASCIYMWNKAL